MKTLLFFTLFLYEWHSILSANFKAGDTLAFISTATARPLNESLSSRKCLEYSKTPKRDPINASLSSRKCLEYSKTAKRDQCKINLETSTASLGDFPHMAAILYSPISPADQPSYNCFGSLISEKFVLTPAHCHFSSWQKPLEVHLGLVNLTYTDGPNVQKIKIKEVIIHPDNLKEMYHDLALVKLDGEARFSQYVHPICLDGESGKFTMAGWTFFSEDLGNFGVDFVDDCQKLYSSKHNTKSGLSKGILADRQICAKIKGGFTLQFGSSLQIKSSDVECMYILVGHLTFIDPQDQQLPAILTRVQPYRGWIEGVVWPEEKNPKN